MPKKEKDSIDERIWQAGKWARTDIAANEKPHPLSQTFVLVQREREIYKAMAERTKNENQLLRQSLDRATASVRMLTKANEEMNQVLEALSGKAK